MARADTLDRLQLIALMHDIPAAGLTAMLQRAKALLANQPARSSPPAAFGLIAAHGVLWERHTHQ